MIGERATPIPTTSRTAPNDVITTLSTVEANLQTLWGLFSSKKVYAVTCDPSTTSTDSWETTANQTISSNYETTGVNPYLRTVPSPLLGVFDITTVTANQAASKWNPGGVTPDLWTSEGLHETQYANLAIAASGLMAPSPFKR